MHTSARLIVAVLSAAVLTLPLSAADAAPPPRQGNQGLQGGWAIDDQGNVQFVHSVLAQLPAMREANAGWVRINFRLGGCFADWTTVGCNGKTALQTYEALVQSAATTGLKVVGLLTGEAWAGDQADWIQNNVENNPMGDGSNAYIAGFVGGAVAPVTRQFSPRITHWEIWSEPNAWTSLDSSGDPTGGSYIYPSNFAQLLRQSHAAIRAAGGVTIAGAIFSHDPEGLRTVVLEHGVRREATKRGTLRGTRLDPATRRTAPGIAVTSCETIPSGADYLCALYDMGIGKAGWDTYRGQMGTYPLDHIGQTLYVDQGGVTSSGKLKSHLQELRSAYAWYEGTKTAKKTWLQEVGWPTNQAGGGVTLAVQAQNLQTAFSTFRSMSFVGRSFWFTVQDIPEAGPGIYYGLVDASGVKKSAFSAFQMYATY